MWDPKRTLDSHVIEELGTFVLLMKQCWISPWRQGSEAESTARSEQKTHVELIFKQEEWSKRRFKEGYFKEQKQKINGSFS